ncbi:MAG: chromosomal replication initiator protein DnaA [Candidatus Eremiobacteraeota bacterium]|nr:chromosomal replication initiator protein DnaA [Candidatus Eremiobacteraeota bacterium]MCW5866797.1 chromosomal replication initiator protein DnaA [Candidatus Eremiobacteraeota bacterium]
MDHPFRGSLEGSRITQLTGNKVTVGVLGKWTRDVLSQKQRQQEVAEALRRTTGQSYQVEFKDLEEEPALEVPPVAALSVTEPEVDTSDSSLNPRYTFSTFIRGSSNNLAAAAAMAVAESPARAYNPLFLYGGVGLGKTHLMQAIGHEVLRTRKRARVVYVSSERFTNELIDSIGEAKMNKFRRTYRNVDVLLIDDIQFLANKERTQEEFFHTFNELHGANKQIVMTCDRPPRQIPTLEDRLRSRFEWGMIADVQLPDFETRVAILKKKAEQSKAFVPNPVLNLIAEKICSNIRELEGALTRVLAHASLQKKSITMELSQEALAGIMPAGNQGIDIRRIQEVVCEYFSMTAKDLLGGRRDQRIVRPRQVAMYLCKELTGASYPEIGTQFGGKDHTTVIHACRKVESNLEDHYIRTSLENIQARLRGYQR